MTLQERVGEGHWRYIWRVNLSVDIRFWSSWRKVKDAKAQVELERW